MPPGLEGNDRNRPGADRGPSGATAVLQACSPRGPAAKGHFYQVPVVMMGWSRVYPLLSRLLETA